MTRKAVIIVALIAIVSLSMAGCTTTTTSTNTTASPTASDTATKLNDAFASQGITVASQFTQTTNQYGNAVYAGVVKDNTTGATLSTHNITIEETKNRTDSEARFAEYVAQAQKAGYKPPATNTQGAWWGIIGQGGSISKAATISISEPNDTISLYRININVPHENYTVSVDYTT
jgi:maltose-binding protein MalE